MKPGTIRQIRSPQTRLHYMERSLEGWLGRRTRTRVGNIRNRASAKVVVSQIQSTWRTTAFKQIKKRERNGKRRMARSGCLGQSIKSKKRRKIRCTRRARRVILKMSTSLWLSSQRQRTHIIPSIEPASFQKLEPLTTSQTANHNS